MENRKGSKEDLERGACDSTVSTVRAMAAAFLPSTIMATAYAHATVASG
jgi:hypothetical protein